MTNPTAAFRIYVISLFGAYVADTYWGRYKTVCVSVAITLFGHILLVFSSVPDVIEHSNGSFACFIIALIIMGLGTGGFKSNISPLVAEQYKITKLFIRYTKSGEKVIVDPALTSSTIYMVIVPNPRFDENIQSTSPVLLSVRQHRCPRWSNRYDLLRKGLVPHRSS